MEYYLLQYPKVEPPEYRPGLPGENYERDRACRYIGRYEGVDTTRRIQRAFWFASEETAMVGRDLIGKPYLEIIRVEILVEETHAIIRANKV